MVDRVARRLRCGDGVRNLRVAQRVYETGSSPKGAVREINLPAVDMSIFPDTRQFR
ncbi:MAG: hypothetical protein IPO30_19720 [Hyphomonadaceae bacterium]|nr:hypothetical protein [Hyphomonadaceae bacterium]MBP9234796.1 hypothetical protein [Hyphomonadaceae bacterium]